jgi:hypothetical protein
VAVLDNATKTYDRIEKKVQRMFNLEFGYKCDKLHSPSALSLAKCTLDGGHGAYN